MWLLIIKFETDEYFYINVIIDYQILIIRQNVMDECDYWFIRLDVNIGLN